MVWTGTRLHQTHHIKNAVIREELETEQNRQMNSETVITVNIKRGLRHRETLSEEERSLVSCGVAGATVCSSALISE
jgi:hypothetical protein